MTKKSAHGIGRKLWISAAVLAALGLCVELGLRISGYAPLGSAKIGGGSQGTVLRVSEDERQRYELTPGAKGPYNDIEVSVNALGLRDREYAREKPPGVRRILVLGDSVSFGDGLPIEEVYSEVLEGQLAERGQSIEVMNLAVTGYDSLQQAAQLERTGLALDPDLVIVGYCFNDLGVQSLQVGQLERLERYQGWRSWSRLGLWLSMRIDRIRFGGGNYDLNEEGYFAARFEDEIADLSGDAELLASMGALREAIEASGQRMPKFEPLPWYASPAHVGKLRHSFEVLAEIAGRSEVPVLLVVIPSLRTGAYRRPLELAYDIVEGEARRVGFDVLRFEAAVLARGPAELRINPRDMIHYDAAGHELVAGEILARLEGSEFIPPR